jgi:hypothetical protein
MQLRRIPVFAKRATGHEQLDLRRASETGRLEALFAERQNFEL